MFTGLGRSNWTPPNLYPNPVGDLGGREAFGWLIGILVRHLTIPDDLSDFEHFSRSVPWLARPRWTLSITTIKSAHGSSGAHLPMTQWPLQYVVIIVVTGLYFI